MSLDGFWAVIDKQLDELKTADTADKVVAILARERDPYGPDHRTGGDAFFAGGGGDNLPQTPLREAGWKTLWYEAEYYWAMQAPDGTAITYVEGDIYRGDSRTKEAT